MRASRFGLLGLALGALALLAPGGVRADDAGDAGEVGGAAARRPAPAEDKACSGPACDAVVDDILQVLKARGIVSEAEYNRMAAKNAAYEEKKSETWRPKIDWSGDFRWRWESFWFDRDPFNPTDTGRTRIRYRFRLKGKVPINEYAKVIFRLASGDNDDRSTNQTLGGDGPDFDTDDIRLDQAYAQLTAPSDWIPLPDGKLVAELGKMPNPFHWKSSGEKIGKDYLLWDQDITLEGGQLLLSTKPAESTKLYVHWGYYIIDENSRNIDPHFWGLQGGVRHQASEDWKLGGRVTYYDFRSIDTAFNLRSASGLGGVTGGGGSIIDGLNGNAFGAKFDVVEVGGYAKYEGLEGWPLLAYGTYSKNLGAERSVIFGTSKQDTAWGVGVEAGSKKNWLKLGMGYWWLEANAFPSQFVDSDLFDGRTNKKGFAVYGSKQVLKNTDFNLTVFWSEPIENTLPAFEESVDRGDRVRLQADLQFKF